MLHLVYPECHFIYDVVGLIITFCIGNTNVIFVHSTSTFLKFQGDSFILTMKKI